MLATTTFSAGATATVLAGLGVFLVLAVVLLIVGGIMLSKRRTRTLGWVLLALGAVAIIGTLVWAFVPIPGFNSILIRGTSQVLLSGMG